MELAKQHQKAVALKDTSTLLAEHHLFRDLNAEVVGRIAALAAIRRLKLGEVLFLKDDEGDALYMVLSGQIRISTTGPGGGRAVILNIIEPGSVRTVSKHRTIRFPLICIKERVNSSW